MKKINLNTIQVMARRWDSNRARFSAVVPGTSLEAIVLDAIQGMRREGQYTRAQARTLARYARCRVDGVEVKRSLWATTHPTNNARIEVLQGVKGGGGGGGGSKNPVATVLSIAVVVAATAATWYLGGSGGYLAASLEWSTMAVSATTAGIGLAAAGALYAINALFPASQPSLSLSTTSSAATTSQVYSITGAKNTANQRGYIPLVCGKHRHTPPLGGKSWTVWEGDVQYFNMLVVWGHPDIEVSDFRIGETPLSDYSNVDHQFHQSTTGDDLIYFAKSYDQQNVGATITQESGWTSRTIGECEDISVDIGFSGLCTIDQTSGDVGWRTVQFQIQHAIVGTDDWINLGGDYVECSAATTSEVVKNFRVEGLTKANRKVRMRRITADTNSQYIRDEGTWSVARAIINQAAFNTRLPYCVSELRIQASEQLSSYVDDFNAICHSKIPDWDADTETWITRTTSNPASIFRYLLTSEHGLVKPYTTAKMDDAAITEFHTYCETNGYEFNFICDSELTTWARLVQVLAAGRGAPTTDVDALWGIVIDRSGKDVKQLFTPRNSWGMSVQRGFMDLPHALRVSFVDETDDYATHEDFVFSDGYSNDGADGTTKATDIVEWDYPGVTAWEKVWRMGRFHLAKLLHRQLTVTINTDFEWLVCHRGDLVGIASDVLMNTFGTARIMRLVYDIDGVETLVGRDEDIPLDEENNPLIPIGVQLDDTVIFSEPSPARYGIAIRNRKSAVTTYELIPDFDGEEHQTLYFKDAVPAQAIPPLNAIVSVSLLGEEYEEYLLASVQPGDNASAELTLIPYAAEEIEAAADGDIPAYSPPVILDVTRSTSLPTPTVLTIRSDESVLVRSSSGGSTPRIAAWWSFDTSTNDSAALTMQIMATDVDTGAVFYGTASMLEDYVACAGVEEEHLYSVRVRALDGSTGKTSKWSTPIRHVCIGRTSLPPAPSSVYLDGTVLKISQTEQPLDLVGHVVKMVFDEDDPFSYAITIPAPGIYTTTGQFDIGPWSGHARRVFVQSIDELGNLSDPVSIAINLGDVLPDNLVFEYSEKENGWAGTIVGGSVVSTNLIANSASMGWSATGTDAGWSTDGTYPAWTAGDGEQLVYTYTLVVPQAYAGGRVLVEPVAQSGVLRSIEYRRYTDVPGWSTTGTDPGWSAEGTDPGWDVPIANEWNAFPDEYNAAGLETLNFRVTYAAGEVAELSDILTTIDVVDQDFTAFGVAIAADGTTRVPMSLTTMRNIYGIEATLLYNEGDTAMSVQYVHGSEVKEGGYITQGPYMVVLDANKDATSGTANITVKGY